MIPYIPSSPTLRKETAPFVSYANVLFLFHAWVYASQKLSLIRQHLVSSKDTDVKHLWEVMLYCPRLKNVPLDLTITHLVIYKDSHEYMHVTVALILVAEYCKLLMSLK